MTAEETVNRIAIVIHSHPAGSLKGWGEIQVILLRYFNHSGGASSPITTPVPPIDTTIEPRDPGSPDTQ